MYLFCLGVVGDNVIVSDYCVIGSECTVKSNETLPSGTVISGADGRRWNKQVNIKVRERERGGVGGREEGREGESGGGEGGRGRERERGGREVEGERELCVVKLVMYS